MTSCKIDVYGRTIVATKSDSGWKVFYTGVEGKRRPAPDIIIPPDIKEPQLEQYLADLCHEWATQQNPGVRRLS